MDKGQFKNLRTGDEVKTGDSDVIYEVTDINLRMGRIELDYFFWVNYRDVIKIH